MVSLTYATDAELVAGATGADRRLRAAAWREILARHRPTIERVLARAAPDDVADAFGLFCVQLCEHDGHRLKAFDPTKAKLSTWLCTLAKHALADWRRRRREGDAGHEDAGEMPIAAAAPEAPSRVEAVEDRALLRVLIGELPAHEQRFVERYYYEELAPEEVAAVEGLALATVYARKWKIEAKLRRLARRYG